MSINALSNLGSTYNFTNVDPLQMQQASKTLEADGVLTEAQAQDLFALGSESSYSPIEGNQASLTDKGWETDSMNLLSSLQNMVDSPEDQYYGSIGQQVEATEKSLLQALTAYQNEHPVAGGSSAQSTDQESGWMSGFNLGQLYIQDAYLSKPSQQALDISLNEYAATDKNSAQAKDSSRGSNVNLSA